jgi:hypothetical protein
MLHAAERKSRAEDKEDKVGFGTWHVVDTKSQAWRMGIGARTPLYLSPSWICAMANASLLPEGAEGLVGHHRASENTAPVLTSLVCTQVPSLLRGNKPSFPLPPLCPFSELRFYIQILLLKANLGHFYFS